MLGELEIDKFMSNLKIELWSLLHAKLHIRRGDVIPLY